MNYNHASLLVGIARVAVCLATIGSVSRSGLAREAAPTIAVVAEMPNLPQPLEIRDWSQVTRDYIDLVFDFERQGDHLPLVRWLNADRKMVAVPSYVGGPRESEAINYLAAVISGTLVGIDMQTYHGQNWVALGSNFFNSDEGICVNRLESESGVSFWYDILPNVLFYQVDALYPNDAVRNKQARSVAEKWYAACIALGANAESGALPNFDHTGVNLKTMQPVEKGWIEPEAAAGIAWIEYMAWCKFHDPKFLTGADWAIRSLEERSAEESPLYEVLMPYGALTAARMNAELNRKYDVAKLVNTCFEARGRPQARPGWGVLTDRWNGRDAHGLIGSTTDGGGYAFAMNTYQWAGALVPLARYDTRYARDTGKWILNLANASRLFYANAHPPEHQSSYAWSAAHDPKSAIAYEGIRKWKRDTATATADYKTLGGRVIAGNYAATHLVREPADAFEVLEEAVGGAPLEHIWEFNLPDASKRWLVVAAERIAGGHLGNQFRFSYGTSPEGPFTPAFGITGKGPAHVVELPAELHGKFYVKVEGSDQSAVGSGPDRLVVDAISISYRSPTIGPFAQGDSLVTFVALLDEATAPIVLYRPATATTDFGLYGSSHVGILGGVVRETNVGGILQLDLLKTDYYHPEAYPSYLFYNPHDSERTVQVEVGDSARDIYDAVRDEVLHRKVSGRVDIVLPADRARILVLTPADGELQRQGGKTSVNGVVVRYQN
jgi:hypothetical protein